MPEDWRHELTFSDRLTATSHLSKAYKNAHPTCVSGEATKQAKTHEEGCRKHAYSLEEYHELIAKNVQLLLNARPADRIEDHHADEHIFPNLPNSGAHIGRYINAQHHADGLFSEVFKAVDPDVPDTKDSNGRPQLVALKITTPDMMTPPHDSKREARILTAGKGDYIVTLLEIFQLAGGRFVLVFPFLPYGLEGLLHTDGMDDDTRRCVLRDTCYGLLHLHSLGIIHRDVKPSNILLSSPSGPAYLTDFGIAWSPTDPASEALEDKILDVGTTCYRPPELLFGHVAYGAKLDMWSLGCVAAQVVCLGRKTLFDAGDLGSELALIRSIFETLGTPDLEVWPEAAGFPDWGKMNFTPFPARKWAEILSDADAQAVNLVSHLVVYESAQRLSAQQALEHPYLRLRP